MYVNFPTWINGLTSVTCALVESRSQVSRFCYCPHKTCDSGIRNQELEATTKERKECLAHGKYFI